MASLRVEYVLHGGADDLWCCTDARMRACILCGKDKVLREFYYKPSTKMVSTECRQCIEQRKLNGRAEREAAAQDSLAKALSKATGRKSIMEATCKSSDGVKQVMKVLGGEDRAWTLVAKAVKKALRGENAEVARKAAATMIDFVVRSEKQEGPPIDLSELTHDDRMQILFEPARDMLLQDAEFRKQLLNDPSVREMLLGEAGMKVLDVQPDPPAEEQSNG